MSDRKLSPEQRAGDIVDAWEHFEGETMRDGHRATLESLIASQIREAADGERGRIAREFAEEGLHVPIGDSVHGGPLHGVSRYNLYMWAARRIRDVRSRAEEPEG